MTYPRSLAFQAHRFCMIWDANSQTHEEPIANEREPAMGFLKGTAAAYDVKEGQRRFLLGQAIDLYTLVRIFGTCFAVQHHHNDHLLALRTKSNGQGAVERKLSEVEGSE